MAADFFVKQEKGEWIFFIEDKLEFEIKKKRKKEIIYFLLS